MITVSLKVTNKYVLSLEGHAGYSNAGSDIVCAGVSTLTYTLYNSLKNLHEAKGFKYSFYDTGAKVEFKIPFDNEEAAIILNTIMTGYRMIAENYPDNVKVQ